MGQPKQEETPRQEEAPVRARCPKCDREAVGKDKIDEHFGWRHNGTKVQSYCRACRVLSAAESRRRAREKREAADQEE